MWNTNYELPVSSTLVTRLKKLYNWRKKGKKTRGECVLHSYAGPFSTTFPVYIALSRPFWARALLLPDQEASQLLVFYPPCSKENNQLTQHWTLLKTSSTALFWRYKLTTKPPFALWLVPPTRHLAGLASSSPWTSIFILRPVISPISCRPSRSRGITGNNCRLNRRSSYGSVSSMISVVMWCPLGKMSGCSTDDSVKTISQYRVRLHWTRYFRFLNLLSSISTVLSGLPIFWELSSR